MSKYIIRTTGDQVPAVPLAAIASGTAIEKALLAGAGTIATCFAKDVVSWLD